MRFVFGAFGNPAPERFLLLRREILMDRGGRHDLFGVVRKDPADGFAKVGFARRDRSGSDRAVPLIHPQVGLPRGAVRPVTGEAGLHQNRANVAGEVDRLASTLEKTEFDDLIVSVDRFSRQNTTLFLAGSFALGMAAARFLRSSARPELPGGPLYDRPANADVF